MAYRRSAALAGLVATTSTTLGTVSLGAPYGVVKGFLARNFASSAMASAGTDAAITVKLTDANGTIFYLDAADRDYKTAAVVIAFAQDDTATGLTAIPTDATGAAATAGAGFEVVVASPITVTLLNGATATDYFRIFLDYEV